MPICSDPSFLHAMRSDARVIDAGAFIFVLGQPIEDQRLRKIARNHVVTGPGFSGPADRNVRPKPAKTEPQLITRRRTRARLVQCGTEPTSMSQVMTFPQRGQRKLCNAGTSLSCNPSSIAATGAPIFHYVR